jgi:hypothetical protein
VALRSAPKTIPLDGAMATIMAAIDEADRERLPEILAALSAATMKASSRLLTLPQPRGSDTPNYLIDVEEASARLKMSTDFMYKNSDKFPFTVRVFGSLRFSSHGIDKFICQHSGR